MAGDQGQQLRPRPRRLTVWAVVGLAAVALCALFPPIRIVRVNSASADNSSTRPVTTEAAAREFWDERLVKSLDRATPADVLLAAIRADANAAREKYSRRIGIGGSYYYFMSGGGRVVGKDANGVDIAIGGTGKTADVVLEAGIIVGNAVRDGTGLLDTNDYPDSQQFNELSAELNKLVEQRVLPPLRERATVGSEVRFTGVAEVADERTDLRPLRVVPISVEAR